MNRLVVVAVAALVALGSGVGLVAYVGAAEQRATESARPVPVFVAASDVPDGTSFEDALASGAIVASESPANLRPPTAVADPAALAGTVADGGLHAGQLVVEGEFTEPGDSRRRRTGPPTFADALADGTVAVSFEATGADAVAELIRPGDRINLLVQVPDAADVGLPTTNGPAVVHVFQDLEVLAVGTVTGPGLGEEAAEGGPPPPTGAYTVAVAPDDAARVLLLTRQYPVFVTLVAPGTDPDDQPPIGRTNALPATLTAEEAVEGREER